MKRAVATHIPTDPIRRIIHERFDLLGLKPVTTAIAAGLERGYFTDFLSGKKKTIDLITTAQVLGLDPEALAAGIASPSNVPIVGYAGAGPDGTVLFAGGDTNFGDTDAPKGATMTTVALEVRGDSMTGIANDGWLIFYDDPAPPSPSHMGEPCVCWLADGRVLVKTPYPGRGAGLFDLESVNAATMRDTPVEQMAIVTDIKTRRSAKRFINLNKRSNSDSHDAVDQTTYTFQWGQPGEDSKMTRNTALAITQQVANRTKEAREGRGISVEAMAAKLGISSAQYLKYEGDESLPSALLPMFEVLTGVEANYLFRGSRARRAIPGASPPRRRSPKSGTS